MRCELDTGVVREVRTAADLDAVLAELHDGGHLILGGEPQFVQIARTGGEVLLERGDGIVLQECRDMIPLGEARTILHAFYNGDESWVEGLHWRDMGIQDRPAADSAGPWGPSGTRQDTAAPGDGTSQGLGGLIADEATRAFKRRAGRVVRQGLRRFLK